MINSSNSRLRIADCGLRICKPAQLRRASLLAPRSLRLAPRSSRLAPRSSPLAPRRGIAAVEFAVVAPILVTIVFGMIQLGRAFEMQTLLDVAAREGARFASMDRTGMTSAGQTGNDKLIQDVKNFLASNGMPKSQITVTVKSHENPTADFDIDDPANDLKLFDVNVSVPFSAVSLQPVPSGSDYTLKGKVVFRNGRATITQ